MNCSKQVSENPNVSLENHLIESNLGLVYHIARHYQSDYYALEDLVSVGSIGLIKAARTFKAERDVLFSTYAGRCITNEILMYLRKNRKHQNVVSLDAPAKGRDENSTATVADLLGVQDEGIESGLEKIEEKRSLLDAVTRLCPQNRALISMRYGLCGQEQLRQSDIAARLGISQSYVSRIEKQTIRHLRGMLA